MISTDLPRLLAGRIYLAQVERCAPRSRVSLELLVGALLAIVFALVR